MPYWVLGIFLIFSGASQMEDYGHADLGGNGEFDAIDISIMEDDFDPVNYVHCWS